MHPDVLQYWDTGENVDPLGEPLDPFWLGVYGNRKAWWHHECAEGQVHQWYATIAYVVKCVEVRGRVPCPGCAPIRAAESAECRALIKRK